VWLYPGGLGPITQSPAKCHQRRAASAAAILNSARRNLGSWNQAEDEINPGATNGGKRNFARCDPRSVPPLSRHPSSCFVWLSQKLYVGIFDCYFPLFFAPFSRDSGILGPCEMDSPKISHSASSQRRRLTKKPPTTAHHHSHYAGSRFSATSDGRVDAQSLGSKRSSTSLRRAPSAPLGPRTPAVVNSTTTFDSSPRFPAAPSPLATRSHTSPILPDGSPAALPASPHSHSHHHLQPRADAQQPRSGPPNTLQPLSSKTSDELIGAPFDGTAILDRIAATESPAQRNSSDHNTNNPTTNHNHNDNENNDNIQHQTPPRSAPPSRPHYAVPGTRTMGHSPPPLRQSATFPAGELPIMSEKTGSSKADSASSFKRYSDESKESKIPSMLRKKSGFSGFMNSLVGSPKKPLISAPENPVHVTHVGYDSSTGQFTVWDFSVVCVFCRLRCADLWTGAAEGVAAAHQRERHHREGHARTPPDPRRCLDILQGDARKAARGPAIRKVPRCPSSRLPRSRHPAICDHSPFAQPTAIWLWRHVPLDQPARQPTVSQRRP